MFNNFVAQCNVFLFRVLLVQNAVLLLLESDAADAIFAIETVVTVGDVARGTHTSLTAQDILTVGSEAIECMLAFICGKITVLRITKTFERRTMSAIFAILEIVAVDDVFAVIEVVSGHILAMETMVKLYNLPTNEFVDLCPCPCNSFVITEMHVREFGLVLFLGVGEIKNLILLVLKPNTSEAILTSRTVEEERRRRAVIAVARERDGITLHTINAFIAKLTSVAVKAIIAILGMPYDVSVRTIFTVNIPEDQIAVTAAIRHIAVVGVLALRIHNRHARDCAVKLRHLFKEGLVKIHLLAIGKRIPPVAPPFMHFKDRKWTIKVIHRDNFLARKIASAVIEIEEITK